MDDTDAEPVHGEEPPGLGASVFRERLRQVARRDADHGGHITLEDQDVYLEDIESVEAEPEGGHRSRVKLRNGIIIGGLTGATIVAALATLRYRRRRK
jgi:hypothetical protein